MAFTYQTKTLYDDRNYLPLLGTRNTSIPQPNTTYCQVTVILVASKFSNDRKFFVQSLFVHGQSDVLAWAFPEITEKVGTITIAAATGFAIRGHLDYLKLMYKLQLLNKSIPLVVAAATGGHFEVLHWLTTTRLWPRDIEDNRIKIEMNRALFAAAKSGHLEIVKWFQDYLPSIGEAYCGAAEGRQLNMLKWLKKKNVQCKRNPTQFAAKGGHLDILLWLKDNGFKWASETVNGAAMGGNLELYHYLVNNGVTVNSATITEYAACGGNIELLEYLHKTGVRSRSCNIAAEKGHLEAVKWLRKEKIAWDDKTAELAALNGHLSIVKMALESGCHYTPDCAAFAATSGHLEVIQYLHKKGYEINVICSKNAATNGYLDTLKWIHEHGYKVEEACFPLAAQNEDFKTMQYLFDIGVDIFPRNEIIKYAIKEDQANVLQWLKDHGGCDVSKQTISQIPKNRNRKAEVWKWLEAEYFGSPKYCKN